jgi:hypothetical protein
MYAWSKHMASVSDQGAASACMAEARCVHAVLGQSAVSKLKVGSHG